MAATRTTLALLIAGTAAVGCSGDQQGPLDGNNAIVFLQRARRTDAGDVFQYTSYLPGAHLARLSPPTADGQLVHLCCDQDPAFAQADISDYDLSFDAREIVFSAKLSDSTTYGLYTLTLDHGTIEEIPTDPNRDYVEPIYLPGDKIRFMTNDVVEAGAAQHRCEYERRTTLQLGVINRDGSGQILGPRNLSHRVFPTLLSDGRLLFTQADHLGPQNAGDLMIVNPDLTTAR